MPRSVDELIAQADDLADGFAESEPEDGEPGGLDEADRAEVAVLLGGLLPDVEVDVPVRDPDDGPVVSAAVEGAAEVIIAGDGDLHTPEVTDWLRPDGVEVLTVAGALERLDRD